MPIDPSQVQWDSPGGIDPSKVQWTVPAEQSPSYQISHTPIDMGQPLANNPFSPGSFLKNLMTGETEAGNSMLTGAKERYYELTHNLPALAQLQSQIASDRQLFAPANQTGGAKLGQFLGNAAPATAAMMIPGLQGYGGAALVGGLSGALQPTTGDESALINTGIGVAGAVGSKFAGDLLAGAITRSLASGGTNRALAQAVGSDASKLNQQAIGENAARLKGIYQAVRTPNVSTDLAPGLVEDVSNGLDASTRQAFEANPNVSDLLGHITGKGQATAAELGNISTGLQQDASAALNAEGANRPLGLALNKLRARVEGSIRSTISDPALADQYAAAAGQYGLFQDVRYNPALLNSTTGKAKMLNIANYLQRNSADFSDASNVSPLYQAARLAQGASEEGKAPPPFNLMGNLGIPWFLYRIGQNFGEQGERTAATAAALAPISRSLRVGLPAAQALRYGLPGATLGAEGTLLPYLEQ